MPPRFALLLLPALAVLPGCTMYVWHPTVTWWGLERRAYERIEEVARGEGGAVYVRLTRNRHPTETWKFTWPPVERADGTAEPVTLEPVPDGEFPAASTGQVRVMTTAELEAIRWGHDERMPPQDEPCLLVGLELLGIREFTKKAELYVMDSGEPNSRRIVGLPDAPVAWESPNAIGHIAVTPVAVTVDLALLPLYLVGCVAFLIHLLVTGSTR